MFNRFCLRPWIPFSLCCTLSVSHFLLALSAEADSNAIDEARKSISYARDIEPIFRENCQGCHQPAKAMGDYVITDFEKASKAGESGEAAIVAGDVDASYLIKQIRAQDGKAAMPKNSAPLNPSEVALITEWIRQGAIDDSETQAVVYDSEHLPKYTSPPVVTALAFSPNGKWLAVSGFHEILLIDAQSRETVQRLVGMSERVESLCFSPDSTKLAMTGGSPGRFGEVQIWDIEGGELALSHLSTFDTLYGGTFSPDGKLFAYGGTDNVVRALDIATGQQVLQQGAHEDWIHAIAFNASGTHLVSGGRDMTVKLTEVATERFVDNVTSITPGALRGGINAIVGHPSRDEILVGGADGSPKTYRIFRETERKIGDDANLIRQFPPLPGRIFAIDVAADASRFVVASTIDGASQLHVYPYDFDSELPDSVRSAMEKRVSERSEVENQLVQNYTNDTSQPLMNLELPETSLYAAAFHPDGNRVVAGGSDGLLRFVDVLSGEEVESWIPVPIEDSSPHATESEQLLPGSGLGRTAVTPEQALEEMKLLPDGEPLELLVTPEQIVLRGESDYAQLVVLARYPENQLVDVTRFAETQASGNIVSLTDLRRVVPATSGKGELAVAFRGLGCSIPVQVDAETEVESIDFVRDVNPILSRLGCNAGTCHGSQKGKNGFKLSLRGYDPVEDIRALSDDLSARRLNVAAPDASVMLLKTTGAVPHEGGVLLTRNSTYYAILRDWIAQGARLDAESTKATRLEVFPKTPVIQHAGARQQFRVVAEFADGSRRDVTHEAFAESGNTEVCETLPGGLAHALRRGEAGILFRYEGAYAAATITVMGDREGFQWQEVETNNPIDELVAQKWKTVKVQPSPLCDDYEFLRRVHLDLTGLPPSPEQLANFIDDPRESALKRQSIIDALIGSENYVEHWTNKWADLLQVNSKFLGGEGAAAFRNWIRTRIDENVPYDQFAREVLTASGSNKENPAASYFKILREPDLMMENTTHLFLGVRFNCNKCHDHPFEKWTQDQYYQLSAFFAQTGLKEDPASEGKRIGGTAVEGAQPLFEVVYDKGEGDIHHVRTNQPVPPEFPFDCDFEHKAEASRREKLAAWLTSPNNQYFARSYVNRLWGYLTGVGLIEPLDDIRAGNLPSNPALLDYLTDEFVNSGFNTEHVIRLICNSRTYQLSVATSDWNADDKLNYSHARAKRLPAEVLYDAIYQVTGAVSAIPGVAPGTRAAALPDVAVQLPDGFLNNLGRPVRESACECERGDGLQLGPVMALVSGPTVGMAISDPKCALPELAAGELSDDELVRAIYLRVLNRPARESEVQAVVEASKQIEVDHQVLSEELQAKESWWKEELARRDEERLAKLSAAREEHAAREQSIAEDRRRLETERAARIAAADAELQAYAATGLELANRDLDSPPKQNEWIPLRPTSLKSSNGAVLALQADRSVVATGNSDKGTYELTFQTSLAKITGFRIEALPLEGIAGGGPGLPNNGNFVVTELEITQPGASGYEDGTPIELINPQADFSQNGFSPEAAVDGNKQDQGGWAVAPRGGVVHWATYAAANPLTSEDGIEFKVVLHQFHNAGEHRLAHFRISVAIEDDNIALGWPEEFAALASIPSEHRTLENAKVLLSYIEKSDGRWLDLKQKLAEAHQPVPPDAELVAISQRIAKLERPIPTDTQLVQLRSDFANSEQQLAQRRLTLAQDLTWALINSPAFLFNH